jgi:hypothetical protein
LHIPSKEAQRKTTLDNETVWYRKNGSRSG